jgi:hypothetical protein
MPTDARRRISIFIASVRILSRGAVESEERSDSDARQIYVPVLVAAESDIASILLLLLKMRRTRLSRSCGRRCIYPDGGSSSVRGREHKERVKNPTTPTTPRSTSHRPCCRRSVHHINETLRRRRCDILLLKEYALTARLSQMTTATRDHSSAQQRAAKKSIRRCETEPRT